MANLLTNAGKWLQMLENAVKFVDKCQQMLTNIGKSYQILLNLVANAGKYLQMSTNAGKYAFNDYAK